MLITKQLKKSNNNIRFSIISNQTHLPKNAGTKTKKTKQAKEKNLHKNLSQLPIGHEPYLKENATGSMANIMLGRGYSSLVASDVSGSLSKSRQKRERDFTKKGRYQLLDKEKQQKIKSKVMGRKGSCKKSKNVIEDISAIFHNKYISNPVDQIKKKRVSGASCSNSKWNNRSVEDDTSAIKNKLTQNRKKYNLSCNDMIENRSRSKSRSKDHSRIIKKKSALNITKVNNFMDTTKDVNAKSKKKKNEKSKTKLKKVSIGAIMKSKGSTGLIQISKPLGKKKDQKEKDQKENRDKKKKSNKSKGKNNKSCKPEKMFIISKDASQDEVQLESVDGYPTNKYLNQKKKSKKAEGKPSLNIRVGLDYNHSSCLNLVSGSSGMMYEDLSSEIPGNIRNNKESHILERISYENTGSINIEEIKYYERNSHKKYSSYSSLKRNPLKRQNKVRDLIKAELEQEYPYLNETQAVFLASVVLIQRKWREYSMWKQFEGKKNIVTEYFEDHRISKQSKEKSQLLIDFSKSKQETISRTKIAEFSIEKNENNPLEESQVDSLNYETRKNTPPKTYHIQIPAESSPNQQEPLEESQPESPAIKSKTYEMNAKYDWIATKEVFPEIQYLEYRKNLIRDQFQCTMKLISNDYSHKVINSEEYLEKKNELMSCYNQDIENLKKTKHDIKKGYLRYIDCINRVKEGDHHHVHQYGLRRVSSQDNFISVLYQKIYKFDSCLSEWSGQSQSVEMLTNKILIRKQNFKAGSQRSQRMRKSLQDIRSVARSSLSSFQMLKSSRQLKKTEKQIIIFDNTDKLNIDETLSKGNHDRIEDEIDDLAEFKFSNQIFNENNANEAKELTNSMNLKKIKEKQTFQRQKPTESTLLKVEDDLMMFLARELEKDLHEINPALVDMILISHDSHPNSEVSYHRDEDEDQNIPFIHSLNREFHTLVSPREQLPVPDEEGDENSHTLFYLRQLILFIKSEQWEEQILFNMNNNQTFEATAYLRFLRDFQVPEEEYVPIISNQKFIDWEAVFINNYQITLPRVLTADEQDIFKQSRAIFHRCIFQVFLAELERSKPYGEKGKPFPWEQNYSMMHQKKLTESNLDKTMKKCLNKIEEYLMYGCGVISEKHFIGSEQDLEQMHEDNEDRIIEMLEQDLRDTPDQWYQIDEHTLQMKLELTYLVQELLLDEMAILLERKN